MAKDHAAMRLVRRKRASVQPTGIHAAGHYPRECGTSSVHSTKVARSGIRISQIFEKDEMDSRLRTMAKGAAARYGGLGAYDVEAEIQRFDVSIHSITHQLAEDVKQKMKQTHNHVPLNG